MAIALRQVTHATGVGVTTLSKAYASSTLPGSLLVCWAINNQSTDFTAITESLGDTIQTAIAYTGDTGSVQYLRLLYCENTLGGLCTWTLSNTNHTGGIQMIIAEYTGVATSSSLDQVTVRATGHSTSPASAALTPAVSNELAISLTQWINNPTITWGAGFTAEDATASSSFADKILSGVTPITASATLSSSQFWGIAQALFKPATILVSSHTSNVTGTTGTYTLTEAVAVNDLITVQWSLNNVASALVPTISDTVNTGNYLEAGTAALFASNKSIGQSYIACNSSGTPTLTITQAGMNNAQLLINHYTGFTNIPTLDVIANTSGTAASFTNSITTTKTLELAVTHTFSDSTITATPSGWTSTLSGGDASICQPYFANESAAGTYSVNATLSASNPYNNWTFSFYSKAAGLSLVSGVGSFTLTGQAATLTASQAGTGSTLMLCNPGAFDWIGAQSQTQAGIFSDFGSFVMTGVNANFPNSTAAAFTIVANSGSFAMTGIDAILQGPNYLMQGFPGSFTWTGFPANLIVTGQTPIPPGFEMMPNLVGLDWLTASAVLWYGGFSELIPQIVKGTPIQMQEGIVIGQTPTAFTVVPNNCAVQLAVASSNLLSVSFESH